MFVGTGTSVWSLGWLHASSLYILYFFTWSSILGVAGILITLWVKRCSILSTKGLLAQEAGSLSISVSTAICGPSCR